MEDGSYAKEEKKIKAKRRCFLELCFYLCVNIKQWNRMMKRFFSMILYVNKDT